MVWVSSREGRNSGVGVDEWALGMKLQQPRNYDFWVPSQPIEVPKWQRPWHDDFSTWPSLRGKNCTHNDRQTTTIASQQMQNDDFCRIVQRPRNVTTVNWQVRNCTIAANFVKDFTLLYGCCRFKCLLGVSAIVSVSTTPGLNTSARVSWRKWDVSWYTLVVYILLSAKRSAYFCKSIAIGMGGVPRYFHTQVSGQGSIWFSWQSFLTSLSVNSFHFCREMLLEIWREFGGFFRTHKIKTQTFQWQLKFQSIFRKKFITKKNVSCQVRSADVPCE